MATVAETFYSEFICNMGSRREEASMDISGEGEQRF
jgi:hypothetical protein